MLVVVDKNFYRLQPTLVAFHVVLQCFEFVVPYFAYSTEHHSSWSQKHCVAVRSTMRVPQPHVTLVSRLELGVNEDFCGRLDHKHTNPGHDPV